MTGELTYLASPYSDPDSAVREARFRATAKAAGDLMRRGLHVYSPIAHTHPIAQEGDLPGDWAFWESFDRTMLSRCQRFIVLQLDGWDRSKGVAAEIAIAGELGLPIEYLPESP